MLPISWRMKRRLMAGALHRFDYEAAVLCIRRGCRWSLPEPLRRYGKLERVSRRGEQFIKNSAYVMEVGELSRSSTSCGASCWSFGTSSFRTRSPPIWTSIPPGARHMTSERCKRRCSFIASNQTQELGVILATHEDAASALQPVLGRMSASHAMVSCTSATSYQLQAPPCCPCPTPDV